MVPARCSSMSVRNAESNESSSENVAIRLPPDPLAVSSAWSALRSRSEVVSRPGTPCATPILTVRVNDSPSIATRSRNRVSSPSATCSAASTERGPAGTTTNSSPPSRAMWPPASTFPLSRSAIACRNQSPAV